MILLFSPTTFLSITFSFLLSTIALQNSDKLLTLASHSGGQTKFLRQVRIQKKGEDGIVITITVEDNARPWQRFLKREFRVFDPAKSEEEGDAQTKRPVVIAYHGIWSSASTMEQLTQFDRQARDRDWLALYPQGNLMLGIANWNGAGCCSREQDDIAFTKEMIDYLVHNFKVDENKVYVAGMSNGGFMVYKLICEMGNRDKTGTHG